MAVKNQAVMSNVSVTAVEVDVEADYDDRGMYHMDGVSPGFTDFRLCINVNSPAPQEKITEIIETALNTSTWFAVFTHSQNIATDIKVTTKLRARGN
jgi:hypothetical protein